MGFRPERYGVCAGAGGALAGQGGLCRGTEAGWAAVGNLGGMAGKGGRGRVFNIADFNIQSEHLQQEAPLVAGCAQQLDGTGI